MRLIVSSFAFVALFIGVRAGTQITCLSEGDGDYQECEVEDGEKLVKSIKLVKYLSAPEKCIEGQTYRIGPDDRSVVVENGCKATFAYKAETPRYLNSCYGNGYKLYQFNGARKEELRLPCKYHAVRQNCGDYYIRLTPGNIWRYPETRLDTIWLGVHKQNGDSWEGRTTNKLSVKYYNGYSKELFNKKDGNLNTEGLLVFGKDARTTWVEDVRKTFRVTFGPWDPDSKTFKQSFFKFECFAADFQPVDFTEQLCGGWRRSEAKERMKELGLLDRQQAMFYDTFLKNDTVQMLEPCIEAESVFNTVCTEAQRIQSIKICSEILSNNRIAKCVTKYVCDPVDTFVACLKWVCGGFKDDLACYAIGDAIDMCPPLVQGNLTRLVDGAKCYKDYIPIIEKGPARP